MGAPRCNVIADKKRELFALVKNCIVGYGMAIVSISRFLVAHGVSFAVYGIIVAGAFLVFATCQSLFNRISSIYVAVYQNVSGNLLLLCVMLLGLIIALVWLCSCAGQALKTSRSERHERHVLDSGVRRSDSPITAAAEDRLDRLPFVDAVIQAIKESRQCQQAEFIAVYGSWGEGKTSVMNILEDRVNRFEQDLWIVKFAPWGRRDKKGYAVELCNTLSLAIAKMGLCNAAIDLRLWGAMLSESSLWDALVHQAGFFKFVYSLIRVLSGPETLESRVREALSRLPQTRRVVVVIDDVDRLMHDEIVELIRLVRTNCDFPGVTYIVVADQNHIETALEREIVGTCNQNQNSVGHEYLEKIFPIVFKLPKLPKERLPNLLLEKINQSLKDRRLATLDEKSCTAQMVPLLVKTMRHVQQCAKEVDSQLYYLYANPQNHSRPCIYEDDYIALTLLRYFYPDVYKKLYEGKDDLFGRRMWGKDDWGTFFMCGDDKIKMKTLTLFLNKVLQFKMEHRNGADGGLEPYWSIDYKSNDAMRDYRMVVPTCYDNYFTGYTERFVSIPKAQVDEFLKMVANNPKSSQFDALLRRFYDKGFLRPLFYSLQGNLEVLKNGHVTLSGIFSAFARIAAIQFDNGTHDINDPVTCLPKGKALYIDLAECLMRLLQREYPCQHERGVALNRIFSAEDMDIGLLMLLALMLEREDLSHHKPIPSHDDCQGGHLIWNDADYDKLLTLFVNRVRMASPLSCANEALLREIWLWLSKVCEWNDEMRDSYDEACEAAISSGADAVFHWLLPFLTGSVDEKRPWAVGVSYYELRRMPCYAKVLECLDGRGSQLPPAWELIVKYLKTANDKPGEDDRHYTMEEYLGAVENKEDVRRIEERYRDVVKCRSSHGDCDAFEIA